jgi:hypothetical protein
MTTLAKLLQVFDQEWSYWGRSNWNLATGTGTIAGTDDDKTLAQYIVDNYCSAVKDTPSISAIADDEYFWSAAGISAAFKAAGFRRSQFPFSSSHSTWIRAFIKARRDGANALYHGFRLNEPQALPRVGDIVGYTYDKKPTFEEAQLYFDKTGWYRSHTDLVVAERPGEIDVIGFNVLDSVTKKTIPLSASGHIADRNKKWFVVLKRHGF